MPERKAQKIADAADMIVGGYAMLRHKQGVRIVNPTFQIIGKLEKFSDGNCGLSASFGNIAA